MVQKKNTRIDNERSDLRPHEEFLQLAAVSTTGELSENEQAALHEHLSRCSDCRQALSEFEAVVNIGAPLLSSTLGTFNSTGEPSAPPQTDVLTGGFATQAAESRSESGVVEDGESFAARLTGDHVSLMNWNYLWLPFAAAVMLTAALGIYSYQIGIRRAPQVVQTSDVRTENKVAALEQKLSDMGHSRELLRSELADRDRRIQALEHEINSESAALSEAKNAQSNLAHSLQDAQNDKQQMAQQESTTSQNLDTARMQMGKMQAELDSLRGDRDRDELNVTSLESQIRDLNEELKQSQQTVGKQEDLLADDRDIRELMGARDLYIAEVYDVARDGATQKAYGRVFYTKGKSLIFYAYDLDQRPGARDASSFQAWGQSGPDRRQALNLGIFYQDNAAKKRWVLRSDDPRALEQINAVFVTIEPHGGSQKPSGRPLLFASLRIEPNHP